MTQMYHYARHTLPTQSQGNPFHSCLGNLFGAIVGLIICAIITLLCGSCTSTRYVPVQKVRTDTLIISKLQRDSIWIHDSTHVSEKQKGDTVWMETERWHIKYKEKMVHDTIYQSHTDSVPVPYPVEVIKKVEKPLSWWQQTRLHLANIVLWFALIAGIVWIIRNKTTLLSILRKLI